MTSWGKRSALLPRVIVVAALVAVGLLVTLGARSWWSGGDPRPFQQPAVVHGSTLVLTYVDSTCRNVEHVDVRETTETVTVTTRTRTLAFACDDVNAEYTVEVGLDAPLGERALQDGARPGTSRTRTFDPR